MALADNAVRKVEIAPETAVRQQLDFLDPQNGGGIVVGGLADSVFQFQHVATGAQQVGDIENIVVQRRAGPGGGRMAIFVKTDRPAPGVVVIRDAELAAIKEIRHFVGQPFDRHRQTVDGNAKRPGAAVPVSGAVKAHGHAEEALFRHRFQVRQLQFEGFPDGQGMFAGDGGGTTVQGRAEEQH